MHASNGLDHFPCGVGSCNSEQLPLNSRKDQTYDLDKIYAIDIL